MIPDSDILASYQSGTDDSSLPEPPGVSDPLVAGVSVVVCTYKRAGSTRRLLNSVEIQSLRPRRLIVVDASPDQDTELLMRNWDRKRELAHLVLYFRVTGSLKGLTRQRNFGIRWVDTDLVAFFDDDCVLAPECLAEMEKVYRRTKDYVVGVGAYIEGSYQPPDRLWRTRQFLRIVADLRPGSYQRSGMSLPWTFMPPTTEVVEGDWLVGSAMMWKTSALREIGFYEEFAGYAQGEDLDFCLRIRRKGKLVLAGGARYQHLFDESGRPDNFQLGYMAIYNRFQIQRRGLENRTWRDVALFAYAWSVDTLMLARNFLFPRRIIPTLLQVGGRLKATADLLTGHRVL